MALIELNIKPSAGQLRWFGAMLLAFGLVVGALLHWRFGQPEAARIVAIAAVVLTAVYCLVAPLRMPIYLGWLYAAYPIGWVISHAIMAVTYYLVMTPIGLAMKLVGYDPLERRIDRRRTASYWVARPKSPPAERYFRQY